jgi:hypothetical protein
MDRAVESNEPFVVERRGVPAAVIMRVQDFIRSRPSSSRLAGESLERGQKGALGQTLRARDSPLRSRHTGAAKGQ